MPRLTRPTRQLHTRPPLERMMKIHEMIQRRDYPNGTHLAQELEVSTKTIQRDLAWMQDRFKLPLAYDSTRRGYFYTQSVEEFPLAHVTEGELLALFLAGKALDSYRHTPYEAPLRHAFAKLTEKLSDDISFNWKDLENGFSFKTAGVAQPDLKIFSLLSEAVMERREVRFQYRKLNTTAYELRQVRPYHLACISHQWYLFAHDLKRNAVRTFVLTRMKEVKKINKNFVRPRQFSAAQLLQHSLGVVEGRDLEQIVIHFDAFAAQLIRERQWHPSQRLIELPQHELELHLSLSSLLEIEPWILSWGHHAEVLQPTDLRRKIRATVRMLTHRYKSLEKPLKRSYRR